MISTNSTLHIRALLMKQRPETEVPLRGPEQKQIIAARGEAKRKTRMNRHRARRAGMKREEENIS